VRIRRFRLFERFTEGGRRAILHSEEEAKRLNRSAVQPEHIFLGLVSDTDKVAGTILAQLGVTIDVARQKVEAIAGRGDSAPRDREIRFSAEAKRVLRFALDEARHLGHGYLGTEHMLLALFHLDDASGGVVLEVMRQFQLSGERVRELVMQRVGAPAVEETRNNVLMCRVSSLDLGAIDTLVEAGVSATRSEAAAWLIRAGIEGNKALFERLQSTVLEIRRLREQAQTITREVVGGDVAPSSTQSDNLTSGGESHP
jgi:ATP-dependent Clp protease ATP-binding subunit ClpA